MKTVKTEELEIQHIDIDTVRIKERVGIRDLKSVSIWDCKLKLKTVVYNKSKMMGICQNK